MEIFEQLVSQFNDSIMVWQPAAIKIASRIFYLLATIQLTWAGILWMMSHDDPLFHLTEFVKKIMVIAFFWTVIDQSGTWIPSIVDGFRQIGGEMTGITQFSPGDVVGQGINISTTLLKASYQGGVMEKIAGALLGGLVALIIFLAFLFVAVEMVLVLIGSKLILVAGLIMLGFAGSQWTTDFTQKYFVTCIHIGIKLMFLTLLVGLAQNLTDTWPDLVKGGIADDKLFEVYFSMMAASILYAVLVVRIPDMGASMLTGSFGMGFGSASLMGGAAVSSGFLLGKMKSIAGNIAGGISKGTMFAAGGLSALNQARKAGIAGVGVIPALVRGSVMHMQEGISKTTGGKIANHIKTIIEANKK